MAEERTRSVADSFLHNLHAVRSGRSSFESETRGAAHLEYAIIAVILVVLVATFSDFGIEIARTMEVASARIVRMEGEVRSVTDPSDPFDIRIAPPLYPEFDKARLDKPPNDDDPMPRADLEGGSAMSDFDRLRVLAELASHDDESAEVAVQAAGLDRVDDQRWLERQGLENLYGVTRKRSRTRVVPERFVGA